MLPVEFPCPLGDRTISGDAYRTFIRVSANALFTRSSWTAARTQRWSNGRTLQGLRSIGSDIERTEKGTGGGSFSRQQDVEFSGFLCFSLLVGRFTAYGKRAYSRSSQRVLLWALLEGPARNPRTGAVEPGNGRFHEQLPRQV